MSSAARLAPRALYEEVAERLRQRIFSGELAAGDWIDELKIADELGISRTPLREAFKVLAAERRLLQTRFGIEHATLQPELPPAQPLVFTPRSARKTAQPPSPGSDPTP